MSRGLSASSVEAGVWAARVRDAQVWMCIYLFMCMYIDVYVNACIYVYIYIYYICTYVNV